VARDVGATCAKSIGLLLDYKQTGELPDLNTEPSLEAQREAAEIIQRQSRDILG
jgi:hypothetical protein